LEQKILIKIAISKMSLCQVFKSYKPFKITIIHMYINLYLKKLSPGTFIIITCTVLYRAIKLIYNRVNHGFESVYTVCPKSLETPK
jgi:hypothetical protein